MAKRQLSTRHAQWLEDARKIPCEIAAEAGVVSTQDGNLAFEYRRNGVSLFAKVRKETAEGKTFWIEPKGAELCLWNEDSLSDPSGAPLIVTEGEIDALSVLAAGVTPYVVSVPNGAALDKPGKGEIVPTEDDAFRYLWDGGRLKAGLQRFDKIILATDDDDKGRILRDELTISLGRNRCWFVTYPKAKDANEVLVRYGAAALRADCQADGAEQAGVVLRDPVARRQHALFHRLA
jgi:twinkle protein